VTAVGSVAALYDIHGNLPALEAVLAVIARAPVELIVVGGDVFPGPLASECLSLLLSQPTPLRWLMGNGDREVLAARRGAVSATVPAAVVPALEWHAAQMRNADAALMAQWPATQAVTVDGVGDVLFCHATPHSDTAIFTAQTDLDIVAQLLGDVRAPVVVCGHTHVQFDRQIGGTRVVNAGSVGMPFEEPGAYWLVLRDGITLQRTTYDRDRAAARLSASAYPNAQGFLPSAGARL
jgi:predicted phosphodiesterase